MGPLWASKAFDNKVRGLGFKDHDSSFPVKLRTSQCSDANLGRPLKGHAGC